MKTNRRYDRRHARGMTLIEIMVVLVILGMIAGAIGWNVLGQLKEANIRSAQLDVKNLANFVESYQMMNGKLPDSLQDLIPKFTKEIRNDPWGQAYVFVKTGTDQFEVVSYGPDKSQGGGDDISSLTKAGQPIQH